MLQPETHRVVWEEATAYHWRQHTRTTPAPKTREQTEEKPTHTALDFSDQGHKNDIVKRSDGQSESKGL